MLRSASAACRSGARAPSVCDLVGLQLERDGLAEHGVLAVLFLRRLVDREHANCWQDDLGR
jgi:hypothetical protein